jgi:hypothetical protein
MKTSTKMTLGAVLWAAMFLQPATLLAQGTAFTYQGRLETNGVPVNGTVGLRPTLWDASTGGNLIAGNSPTDFLATVTNGLFTATLNFGGAAFNGQPRWLQWEINPGSGPFTTLSPRQPVTPTPYAMIAGNVSGVIANSSLPVSPTVAGTISAGSFAGSGAGLTDLNASQLTSGTVPAAALGNAWRISGNAGTTPGTHFLGTTDNQALEVRVNNQRALRLQPDASSPLLLGGFAGNTISGAASGAVIAGGGASGFTNTIAGAPFSVIGGGRNNQIWHTGDGLIAGGAHNRIESAFRAAVVGGDGNVIRTNATWAFVGGGEGNLVDAGSGASLIGGGRENRVGPNADSSVIGGGRLNAIGTNSSTGFLGGGFQNSIQGQDAVLVGGRLNTASSSGVFLGGGQQNQILANSPHSVLVGGQFNNLGPDADYAFIGGGQSHQVSFGSFYSVIAGGLQNSIGDNAAYAAIGGGAYNSIPPAASYATIPGGRFNSATNHAFAAGTRAKANHPGAFVWADATDADFASTTTNQFNVRASGGIRLATSGAGMTLDGQPVTTGTNYARLNVNQTFTATNLFTRPVGIGVTTPLRALHVRDLAGGNGGDVQIGNTSADGTPKLIHFGDASGGSGTGFVSIGESGADDRMVITAGTFVFTNLSQQGRVGIGRLPAANKLEVEGDASKTTAGSWLANSDARIKQDITPVTGALAKLEQVRLVSFRYSDEYRAQHPSVEDRRYLNVVAQEFHEIFPEHVKSSGEKLADGAEILQVDTYPLTIYTAAAVQELHRELRRRDAENAALKARLEKLEQRLEAQLAGGAR